VLKMLHLAPHNESTSPMLATTHKHVLLELILRSDLDSGPVVVGTEHVRSHALVAQT